MHYEVLEEKTRKIFEKFSFLKENFYLAGGTALALQIGHRKSIDLDFFSDEPIKKTLLKTIESKIKTADSVVVNNKKELTFYIESIKVTFLHYPFSHKHFSVKNNIFPLASISEIATPQFSATSCSRLAGSFFTQASRSRLRICCISLSRTIHFRMATSASARFCLSGFCSATSII